MFLRLHLTVVRLVRSMAGPSVDGGVVVAVFFFCIFFALALFRLPYRIWEYDFLCPVISIIL